MENHTAQALGGAECRPHTALAEGGRRKGWKFTRGRGQRAPRGDVPSSCDNAPAGTVLSLESHRLPGGEQKVISWALISKLVKGAVGNSSQLVPSPPLPPRELPAVGVGPCRVFGSARSPGPDVLTCLRAPGPGTVLPARPLPALHSAVPGHPQQGPKPRRSPLSLRVCSVENCPVSVTRSSSRMPWLRRHPGPAWRFLHRNSLERCQG